MGSPDEEKGRGTEEGPTIEVHIQYAFSVSKHPITRAGWKSFVKETGHRDPSDCLEGQKDNHPVVCVSWQDARDYADWLTRKTGHLYRLLTEAEWEYSARAGTMTAYYWGDEMGAGHASCIGCGSQWGNQLTAPVGSFAPNPWGLYDMAGNVESWTQDCYHDSYSGAPTDGSAWETNCWVGRTGRVVRVVRGGSWATYPGGLRSAYRAGYGDFLNFVGFRVARTAW
jgi:formylglycine-generating enzyme required for sulfatase activity